MTIPTQAGAELEPPDLSRLRVPRPAPGRDRLTPIRRHGRGGRERVGLGLRHSVLFGFVLICAFISAVGVYSAATMRHSAALVAHLFDESLMTIDDARAADADFADMKANVPRQRPATSARNLDDRARARANNFARDLRAQSAFIAAATLTALLLAAAATWVLARRLSGPIAAAAHIADRIAGGDLAVVIPDGRRDELGSLLHAMQVMRDSIKATSRAEASELRSAHARIAFMAQHDSLTKLPNRGLFAERLEEALGGRPGAGFAMMLIDLDRFRDVNDTRGHRTGDRLLRVVAERLAACCRPQDTVARLGGDEFAILQAGVRTAADAQEFASRVVSTLEDPIDIDGGRIEIRASIGIAVAPEHGTTPETLLRNADTALHRVREERCAYRIFSPSMDAALQHRRAIERDLLAADFDAEMELYYQPIVDIGLAGSGADAANRVAGYEALLRWHHPAHGLMMPGDFIRIAEETGLIEKLGAWIIRRACADARNWPAALKVAVNVSPRQFRSGRLVERLEEALSASGIAAARLELEITETTLLDDNETTRATLRRIQALGMKIALDDFGTGFSSLSYLRSFPFDRIKIDRSFVMDLGQRADAAAIIRAILGLGRSLNIPVIAEGVETPEQLSHLRAEGCGLAQGFLFSRPVERAAIPQLSELRMGTSLAAL